jgi:hypothetical protein
VSSELLATETSFEPVADSVEGDILSESADPAAVGLTAGLTQLTDSLIGAMLDRVGDTIHSLEDLTSKLAQAVSWLLGGGDGVPSPIKDPLAPPASPASGALPPAVPIPSGGNSPAAGFLVNASASSGGAFEDLLKEFGICVMFSIILLQGGKMLWPSCGLLRPDPAPESAIERPG